MKVVEYFARVSRTLVFWIGLVGVLGFALALGANRPISWTALWAFSALLFGMLILLDIGSLQGATLWRRSIPIVVLGLGVLLWGIVQAGPTPVAAWAHPAWSDAANIGALDQLTRKAWPWSQGTSGQGAAAISAEPQATLTGVMRLSTYLMLFWVGARGVTDKSARLAVQAIALFGILLAIYGLVALFNDHNPIVGEPGYPGAVTASFVNKNAYAFYASIGAMACLSALSFGLTPAGQKNHDHHALRNLLEAIVHGGWVWFAGFVLLVGVMFYAESRGGAVAGLIGIATVLFLAFGHRRTAMRWSLLPIFGVPLIIMAIGAGGLIDRILTRDPSQDGRLQLYTALLTAIGERPWLGYGLGSFQDAFRPFLTYELGSSEWELAHNSYLENAFELGVPAAAALTLIPLLIIGRLIYGLRIRKRQRSVLVFGIAVLVAGGLHALVDFSMQMPATAALAALLSGIGWSQSWRDPSVQQPIKSRRHK